ncbi:unnamed protein product [Heterobilharzia americana]|nr:unnamed protein product [Heterobilharzia americana]
MYLESPEYIKHSFGFSHSLTTSASSLNRFGLSPKRSLRRLSQNIGGSQQQTSLFGSAFMNVFGSQSVDGQSSGNSDTSRLPISSSRRSQRDRLGNIISEQSNRCNMNSMTSTSSSNATEESFTNQHVSGIKHLPEQSQQIDLSQCTVHIRGLSRPEVTHLNRNALGAIAASAVSPLISSANITTPSSQIIHLPSSMNSSISTCNDVVTNNNNISVSTTAVRDISYRNKISNELNNLIGSSSVVGPQPTVTSSNPLPQLSPQFMFNVVTETVINGVRRQVVKVTRKYSEFYVLEQKLIEFHGSFITKQLPRRQLTPRSMEFLESKCEIFESYLQYLISQPFLRKSKLLYSFLTSNEPFNTNLFELNLGRFVKSVPLKLTKEKGQFLDDFLTSYYLSCHPQPIETDNTFDEHEVTKSKSLSTYPSINSTVGGVNTTFNFLLNSSDHNPRSNKASISSQLTMPKSIFSQFRTDKFVVEHCTDYYSRYVLNSVQYKSQGRTSLDHRLRSRVYWNNAGLTYEKRKDTTNDSSQLSTVHLDGLSEMIFYLFDKIITCSPISSSSSSNQQSWLPSSIETKVSIDATVESKTDSQLSTDINSLDNKLSIDPWDVTNPCWSEAFLNGPPIPIVKDNNNNNNNNNNTYETIDYQSVQQPTFISQLSSCNNMKIDNQSTNTSIEGNNNLKLTVPILSISLQDLCLALYELYALIGKQCKMCLRQLLLRIGFILITYFKTPIDNWLTKYLMLYFYNTFSDENFANMLDNIKTNIFFHSTKKVDMDKSERKEKARAALEKAVLDITGISYLTDVEKIREKVNLVFDCFQYSKWNKQLTYALLDQFILELFPELGFNNNDNISRDVRKESSQ